MRIERLTAHVVRLTLRRPFEHATCGRATSDNVVVCCRLADGTEGWGEGVPRSYVTGETPAGVLLQLAATDLARQLDSDCGNWSDVIRMCTRYAPDPLNDDPRGCRANAHRCAVELSILDAYGRLFGEPLRRVARAFDAAHPIIRSSESVQYSGAVSIGTPIQEAIHSIKMRVYGFRHCKVKVGRSPREDIERLRRVRRWLGPRVDLRVDANEAWRPEEVVERVQSLLKYGVQCVEQPVPHRDVACLSEIRRRLPVPIMLDESLTSMTDADAAIRHQTGDLFNIRLSKCGGMLNALRLAARAHEAGWGYQLGCHPGESGILSAAGRHFATAVGGARYLEGSYDRHLLAQSITHEDITFGYGGRAPALRGPGLGVTVRRHLLDRLTLHKTTFWLR